ncbi:hypothetical protein FH972_026464 [Carpinus fangiana]|uniref:Spindle pole body component n=1 Tax=Carpinus fangiana TaxID=176857 RepID=A0A5N6L417_9ROSI|nr:hypothetical protein FH972_026464 [Carpinus fangiana]
MTARVPAWRRLGLELSNPSAQPEPAAPPPKKRKTEKPGALKFTGQSDSALKSLQDTAGPASSPLNGKSHDSTHVNAKPRAASAAEASGAEVRSTAPDQAQKGKRKKSVSFADDVAFSEEQLSITAAVNPVAEDQPSREVRQKRKREARDSRRQKEAQAHENIDPSLNNVNLGASPTKPYLQYLDTYLNNRAQWKFNKSVQTSLLKDCFNPYRIPAQYDEALLVYISGLQGQGARARLADEARIIIDEPDVNESDELPGTSDMKYSNAPAGSTPEQIKEWNKFMDMKKKHFDQWNQERTDQEGTDPEALARKRDFETYMKGIRQREQMAEKDTMEYKFKKVKRRRAEEVMKADRYGTQHQGSHRTRTASFNSWLSIYVIETLSDNRSEAEKGLARDYEGKGRALADARRVSRAKQPPPLIDSASGITPRNVQMSRTNEQRIDVALTKLVEGILPDEQVDEALDAARNLLEENHTPQKVPDVNHVGDLIKRRLVRDNSTPDRALRFGNLFERLLAQPVLNQKWGILLLLHQLSNIDDAALHSRDPRQTSPSKRASSHEPRGPSSSQQYSPQKERRTFDDAFARPGLPTLPSPDRTRTQEQRRNVEPRPIEPRRRRTEPLGAVDTQEEQDAHINNLRSQVPATETSLLRDLPFTLQGVSSNHMSFSKDSSLLRLPDNLPAPMVSLLHALAEPSLLYKGLAKFVDTHEGGLIGQSLRSAIGLELRSYLSLVATLEGQIRRALAVVDGSPSRKGLGQAGVTLKRCVIWTREATMGLRLLSLIVDESKTRKGGQLISLIHSFSASHGDPFVGVFAERLLSHVTQPFYDMLRLWIYDGELSDPYLEFFVLEQTDIDNEDAKGRATSVWEDKYRLNRDLIPSIITEEFARKVFLIGKSLNFIRYGCGDSEWVDTYSKEASRELHYGDTATLETSIDQAYKTTMARLIWLMNDKFRLQDHLVALKKYLLLGQGDFIALLMESLAVNLNKPANSQYRHALTAQLEHAIRNSNAQYDPADVLRRLDARMLELSHGEIGWDVFTLEYKIDAPVDVIVTPYASKQYLKVFNFLWRVKRVEYALGTTWRQCMTGARGPLTKVADKTGSDWKSANLAVGEMIHFINQLQYYILFEVIESSWKELQEEFGKPGATLDDLIQAHARYLKSITRKGLLGSSSHLDFPSQLHELLKTMLAYREAVEGLYAFSVAEYSRRQEKSVLIETRTKQGRWGVTERDEDDDGARARGQGVQSRDTDLLPPLLAIEGVGDANDASTLPALRQRLTILSNDFRARVSGLLGDLAYQPDPDMRFLGVVMNFNNTYKVMRRSRRKAAAEGGGVAGGETGKKRTDR